MQRSEKVAASLAELAGLDRRALADRWQAVIGHPPPKAASRAFLLRALAYELQSKHAAGLSKSDHKALRISLGSDHEEAPQNQKRKPPAKVALPPGSRLVREWNGQPYTVSVIKEGFVYRDRTWTSLSAIAKDITGAHWSGPRFFGLDKAT